MSKNAHLQTEIETTDNSVIISIDSNASIDKDELCQVQMKFKPCGYCRCPIIEKIYLSDYKGDHYYSLVTEPKDPRYRASTIIFNNTEEDCCYFCSK